MLSIDCTSDGIEFTLHECGEEIVEAWLTRQDFEPVRLAIEYDPETRILTLTSEVVNLAQGVWLVQMKSACACYRLPVWLNTCPAPVRPGEHEPTSDDQGIIEVCCGDFFVRVRAAQTTPAGQDACFEVILDRTPTEAFSGVVGQFSGSETPLPAPIPLTFAPGETIKEVCVPTDPNGDADTQLCMELTYAGELDVGVGPAACTRIAREGEPPGDGFIVSVTCPGQAQQGHNVCYTVTLNRPAPNPLALTGRWSGSDFDAHGYPQPVINIAAGATSGDTCVQTQTSQNDTQLCLTVPPDLNPQVELSNVCCTDLQAPALPGQYVAQVTGPNAILEGQEVCYTIKVVPPVTGQPLTINSTLSGSNQDLNNYPQPNPVLIPVTLDSAQVCVQTTDLESEEDTQLCLTVDPQGDVVVGDQHCTTVVGSAIPPTDNYTITIRRATGTANIVLGGDQIGYQVNLDRPLESQQLSVLTEFSGQVQNDMNLTPPTFEFAQGQTSRTVFVGTDQVPPDYLETLTLEFPATPNPRITNLPQSVDIQVSGVNALNWLDNNQFPNPEPNEFVAGSVRTQTINGPSTDVVEFRIVLSAGIRFDGDQVDVIAGYTVVSQSAGQAVLRVPAGASAGQALARLFMRIQPGTSGTTQTVAIDQMVNSQCNTAHSCVLEYNVT